MRNPNKQTNPLGAWENENCRAWKRDKEPGKFCRWSVRSLNKSLPTNHYDCVLLFSFSELFFFYFIFCNYCFLSLLNNCVVLCVFSFFIGKVYYIALRVNRNEARFQTQNYSDRDCDSITITNTTIFFLFLFLFRQHIFFILTILLLTLNNCLLLSINFFSGMEEFILCVLRIIWWRLITVRR